MREQSFRISILNNSCSAGTICMLPSPLMGAQIWLDPSIKTWVFPMGWIERCLKHFYDFLCWETVTSALGSVISLDTLTQTGRNRLITEITQKENMETLNMHALEQFPDLLFPHAELCTPLTLMRDFKMSWLQSWQETTSAFEELYRNNECICACRWITARVYDIAMDFFLL